MNIGRILFIAIFLFSSTTLLTVSAALEAVKNSFGGENFFQQTAEKLSLQELERQYQENLLKVLQTFTSNQSRLTSNELGSLEEQLLGLTVSPNLKDLHFKLITSLETLRKQPAAATSQEQLVKILNQYSWLAASLSVFIMNNF